MPHYYYKKYPYLNYPYLDTDGQPWIMFSIPAYALANMYKQRLGTMPQSFFDCGAAIGELVRQADEIGMDARGIDIRQYPLDVRHAEYFKSGRIQIKSILDCAPIKSDLAYCNGTLTYMDQKTLPLALSKFKNVGMLIAAHNTTEDIEAARAQGDDLQYCSEPRLIKSRDWWMNNFVKNGFLPDWDSKYQCFCVIPKAR